jgi:hypothetical protein
MPIRPFNDESNFTVTRAALTQSSVKRLESLSVLISSQQRQLFVKKIFGGDAVVFDKLVNQLEISPNWSAALRLLENYFYRANISPYHNDAARFSDLIYKRYFPNDVYIG